MTILVGDYATFTATFTSNGSNADPTAVAVEVRDPSGNIATPSPSTSQTGIYTTSVDFDEAGLWTVKFTGTGAVKKVLIKSVVVEAAALS